MLRKNLFCLCLFGLCLSCSFRCITDLLFATASALCSLGSFRHILVEVNKLNESNISAITLTVTQLDNACVTTGTISDFLCDNSEEFLQGFFILQVAEHNATRVGAVILRAGEQGLNIFFQGLCLSEGRSDSFVHNQRNCHVSQHSLTVVCSTAQMIEFLSVSHFCF